MSLLKDQRSIASFRRRMLAWYDINKRPLPWRTTRDPYRIWVSEVMLQQTRVAAVIGYYKRFLDRFPTVRALAKADEQQVLARWSGLGYYRRARMMHEAARKLMKEGRAIPTTSVELRQLPGIGKYTAAAIASMAFGERSAVVDGNVERILLRLSGSAENSGLDYWSAAELLLDLARPGDFNQAMMELGATVCLPKSPQCSVCPVNRWCKSRGQHRTSARESRKSQIVGFIVSLEGQKIALTCRPQNARLMPGMWELPMIENPLPRRAPRLALRHSITNTDYVVKVFCGTAPKGSLQLSLKQAAKLPLTGLTRKVLRRLELLKDEEH